jgi:hypothetical protein
MIMIYIEKYFLTYYIYYKVWFSLSNFGRRRRRSGVLL